MPEHLSPSPGLPGSAAGAHHSGAALGPRSGFWVWEEGSSRHGAVGVQGFGPCRGVGGSALALACDSGAYPWCVCVYTRVPAVQGLREGGWSWVRPGPLGDSAFSSICCGCQHPGHKAELRSSKEWKAGEKPVVVI